MNPWPKVLDTTPLYTAEQTRELDRTAIDDFGIPGIQLMKQAGREVFDWLQQYHSGQALHIFCGAGNNGGDGYIVAGLARAAGWAVQVHWLSDPEKLKGDAQLAFQFATGEGAAIAPFTSSIVLHDGVIVDALLGTGLNGPVRESYRLAIAAINASGLPVVAVDIPSGLSADTGASLGAVVEADCTLTFIGMKQGLLTGEARNCCGELLFADLGVPADVYRSVESTTQLLDLAQLLEGFTPRARCAHKGSHGHLLVVGGDSGMGGAVAMAAQAALRCGAGLVSVATRPEHIAAVLSRLPEAMVHGVSTGADLQALLAKADAVVIGPGLGQSSWSEQLLQVALASGLPLVVDADALNLLVKSAFEVPPNTALTPHPGEAARLLETDTVSVQADRFAAVRQLQQKFQAHVLLKGAGTLTCSDQPRVAVCPYGNPGMAVGGMGDVLSGVIGGLLVQDMALQAAMELGVCLHSRAADIASSQGERGLLPTDLLPILRKLVNGLCQ